MALFKRVALRLRAEEGFGLIELLAAMLMLNIGILALVAAFTSGQVALTRSGRVATAASLADRQMELYRAIKYDKIKLDLTSVTAADSTYQCDAAYGGDCNATDADPYQQAITRTDCTGTPLPNECLPVRTVVGADRKTYRVDTYITEDQVTSGRDVRRVTVVVRNPNDLGQVWARQSSNFDQSTG